jgi:hypothetical protein
MSSLLSIPGPPQLTSVMNATKPDRRSRGPKPANPPTLRSRAPSPSLQAVLETLLLHVRHVRTWLRSMRQLLVCGECISPIGGPRATDFLTRAHGWRDLGLRRRVASPTPLTRAAPPASTGSRPWRTSPWQLVPAVQHQQPTQRRRPPRTQDGPVTAEIDFHPRSESRRTVPRGGRGRSALIASTTYNGLTYDPLPARGMATETAHFVQSRHRRRSILCRVEHDGSVCRLI